MTLPAGGGIVLRISRRNQSFITLGRDSQAMPHTHSHLPIAGVASPFRAGPWFVTF
jgi:hypothetical protein